MLKQILTTALLSICFLDTYAQAAVPPAGTFRLGIAQGKESRWLQPDEQIKNVTMRYKALPHTRGFVLEVESGATAQTDTLYWSFGDCRPDADINVFSIEGQAFTCYYGESMKLRTVQAIVPSEDIRLSNGHQDQTPRSLHLSGKKTDRPVLSGRCPLPPRTKLYFCFYEQNAHADYNYFMLPGLFASIDTEQ